jgi:hypothetical protein
MNETLTKLKERVITQLGEAEIETNSGAIIEDIKSTLKINNKPWDFSNFPIDGEKIDGLILTNIERISFTNYGSIYYSIDNLKEFGFEHPEELSGRFVVYDKILDTGGHYFGYTGNYGQRGLEHSLTNISGEYQHYVDFRKYGRCFIRVLSVRNTPNYAKADEDKFIGDFVKKVFHEKFPSANIRNFGRKEIAEMVSDRIYNKQLPNEIYD